MTGGAALLHAFIVVNFSRMRYGFSEKEWDIGKAEMTGILSQRAKSRAMITYSDLSSQLRTIRIAHHEPAMGSMLGEISTEEYRRGHGMLSVIVVHKYGDMEPGNGFYECAEDLGLDTSDRVAFWIDQLHKVHGFWSNTKCAST
jgi:hypothetical protein